MTAINDNGQVYWTFEELDFDGAIEIIRNEIKVIQHELKWSNYLTTIDRVRLNRRIVARNMVINRIIILKNWEDINNGK